MNFHNIRLRKVKFNEKSSFVFCRLSTSITIGYSRNPGLVLIMEKEIKRFAPNCLEMI